MYHWSPPWSQKKRVFRRKMNFRKNIQKVAFYPENWKLYNSQKPEISVQFLPFFIQMVGSGMKTCFRTDLPNPSSSTGEKAQLCSFFDENSSFESFLFKWWALVWNCIRPEISISRPRNLGFDLFFYRKWPFSNKKAYRNVWKPQISDL